MEISDAEIRQHLSLAEDNRWEFKKIEFAGNRPKSPSRDDLAEELLAFANTDGGILHCGVTDEGQIQGMSRDQLSAVDRLLGEISTDSIRPPLRIKVFHRVLDGRAFILVEVPRSDSIHERDGRAFVRVGATKRSLDGDEKLRLSQNRAQSRFHWFDKQVVPDTGFKTLDEKLWGPLLSTVGSNEPRTGLLNRGLLAFDSTGVERVTVAGILLCTPSPHIFLPQAIVMATHYRGHDRASGQLDAQEIVGPLPIQIKEAIRFITRNMRVAAGKLPAREDMPQYSPIAVFEAIVNAVVHRDYSMAGRNIRVSMFKDRLEIDSPGSLPNGMTVESMETSQATRNETIASVFSRLAVGEIPGARNRRFLMERRGYGVSIIKKETHEASGNLPEFKEVERTNVVLTLSAAKLELSPSVSTVTVHSSGEVSAGIDVLALFPNKTWQRATTDDAGEAFFELYTTHLPMTVYAAAPGYSAELKRDWVPNQGGLLLELTSLANGGSVIFAESTGQIPGLQGRINPIRDEIDRLFLYANNVSIEDGTQQPVPFRLGNPLKLIDSFGAEFVTTIVEIIGESALVEYQSAKT